MLNMYVPFEFSSIYSNPGEVLFKYTHLMQLGTQHNPHHLSDALVWTKVVPTPTVLPGSGQQVTKFGLPARLGRVWKSFVDRNIPQCFCSG